MMLLGMVSSPIPDLHALNKRMKYEGQDVYHTYAIWRGKIRGILPLMLGDNVYPTSGEHKVGKGSDPPPPTRSSQTNTYARHNTHVI